jgi:hypothetical protein
VDNPVVILWCVLGIGLAVVVYWLLFTDRVAPAGSGRPSWLVSMLVFLSLILIVWSVYLERPAYSYNPEVNPVAIAIAFDLSPSMLAIPDPSRGGDITPRYQRAVTSLLELLGELEDRQIDVLVSMVGFTEKAEVIMGWESNISQIREMLQYVVSPDLFTTTGTSIEAATKALIQSFNTLPKNLKEDTTKVAVIVSDGEDTLTYSYLDYVMDELEANSFDIITLQTGLLDQSEGVPRYGEFGEFLDFEPMGGKLYTVPDVETMMRLSEVPSHRGLYVRAESDGTALKMLGFIANAGIAGQGMDQKLLVILGLFILASLLYARQVM